MTKPNGVDLAGQVALVTGGGRGIGRTIAEHLGKARARVCLVGRTAEDVEQAASAIRKQGGSGLGLALDVTDRTAVNEAFARTEDEFGPISLVINNAGTLDTFGPLWERDPDAWWQDMEVHVRGTLLCSHAALTRMVPRREGRIVNVVGMLGQRGEPYATAYACAKAAIFRLTDCLSSELEDTDVRVFCISPGPVRTDMTRRLAETDEGRRWLPAFSELSDAKWLSADEGAQLVGRIARGDADGLSGRFIHVDHDLDDLIAHADEISLSDRLVMRVTSWPPAT